MQKRESESDWPDWKDAGKRVEVKLESGVTVRGELIVDDFFPDGNGCEVPMFMVLGDEGTKHGFAANKGWMFVVEDGTQRLT